MNRITARRTALLLAIAAAVLAGAWGAYRIAVWRHNQKIEARLNRLAPIIWKHAQANALPTELVRRMIRAESGGDERAVSPKNAKGLMQITPVALAEVLRDKSVAEGDLFDPDYNICVGTKYFRMLLARFGGDAYLAVAAYNMGLVKLLPAWRANPKLPGREIVARVAPPATIRYCHEILGDRDLHLPQTPGNH